MLQAIAGDQHAGGNQGIDHHLVGIALLALVVDDARALETRRVLGEGTILVDGVGDGAGNTAGLLLSIQTSKSSRPWPGAVWTKPVPASSVT